MRKPAGLDLMDVSYIYVKGRICVRISWLSPVRWVDLHGSADCQLITSLRERGARRIFLRCLLSLLWRLFPEAGMSLNFAAPMWRCLVGVRNLRPWRHGAFLHCSLTEQENRPKEFTMCPSQSILFYRFYCIDWAINSSRNDAKLPHSEFLNNDSSPTEPSCSENTQQFMYYHSNKSERLRIILIKVSYSIFIKLLG